MRPAFLGLIVVLAIAPNTTAQNMPDPSQMAGVPLPAPGLAAGTVTVRVMRERIGNNVADQPVTLKSGATTRTAKTDAQGRAQFIEIPAGTMVVAATTLDGETLTSQEFPVPATGGVRVALIGGLQAAAARERTAAEAAAKEPARPGIVVFGGETRIILEFQDDNLQVFYLLDIQNAARTPIDIGGPLVIDLPTGAAGAALMQGSSALAGVQGDRVTVRGPFPPGSTPVQVGFAFPNSRDTLTIAQSWPAAMDELFVAVEKIGDMRMTSPQFSAQREAESNGQKFLMATGPRLEAGSVLAFTLSGLPHRPTTLRTAGLGLAVAILAIGLWAALCAAPAKRGQAAQLAARREKLFTDLVALEKQQRAGKIEPARYASRRQALVAQLEKVLGELDRAPSGGGADVAA